MKTRSLMTVCISLLLAGTGTAVADDEKKAAAGGAGADPQAMMEAYEKAGEPTEQHKLLQKYVGKWNINIKSWMDPKQPPVESTGTAEGKSVLGDRFVQSSVTATMMGKPFSGLSTTGYDKGKKKIVGTWIDSMSTGIMRSEGTTDAAGKKMTVEAVATDPLTGKDGRMRIVSSWESDDKIVEEFFEKKKGKEVKTMEITYTRAK